MVETQALQDDQQQDGGEVDRLTKLIELTGFVEFTGLIRLIGLIKFISRSRSA